MRHVGDDGLTAMRAMDDCHHPLAGIYIEGVAFRVKVRCRNCGMQRIYGLDDELSDPRAVQQRLRKESAQLRERKKEKSDA